MKTTIEIKGYQIVIDESEEVVVVTAVKDDETIEEFSLNLSEDSEEVQAQGEEGIKSFGDFGGEEEDFGAESEEIQDEMQDEMQDELQDEMQDELQDEIQDEEEGEEDESALESFQSFINKKK